MLPYYIFFSFFGISSILDYLKQDIIVRDLKKYLIFFGLLLIFFFVGLRYELASDWLNYSIIYNNVPSINSINFDIFIEPGFNILLSLFKTFGLGFESLVFFITVYNATSLFAFIRRNQMQNKMTFIAIILILNIFKEFDILRQSLAFYTMLYAFSNKKTNPLRYIIICLIAISFHYTAFVFFLFYIFLQINISKIKLFFILIFYLISLFYTIPIISSTVGIFDPSFQYIAKTKGLISSFGFQRDISFSTLLNLLFLTILYLNSSKLKSLTHSEIVLLKMFLFYMLLHTFCKEIKEVADRITYYFAIGLAFMFCLLPTLIAIKHIKKYILIIPFIFIILKLGMHSRNIAAVYGITPYRNVLLKENYNEIDIMQRYQIMQDMAKNFNGEQKTK
jgi:hypothetical protein